jgi:CBS domain-containing protein
VDILGFLGRYAPFDQLDPDRLASIARKVEIEHFPAGKDILQRSGEPAHALYVVRKGAVELLDDGRLIDLLGEGEVFGQFSLLSHEGPTLTVRAHEDTLCYLLPAGIAGEVLGTSAGLSFVIGSMRQRIASAAEHSHRGGDDPRYRTVATLVRRAPVTARPDTTIADAARLMASERVSSVLIPMRGGWGIATDRDLRSRVVAVRGALDDPVETIASFPAITIRSDALAGDALVQMFAHGVHHFPVTEAGGVVVGVITDTDLMGLGRHTPFAIKSAIERSRSAEEVSAAGLDLPEVVCAMVEARADPVDVGRVAALVIDAMTEKLLELGAAELGDAPCSWAWLALGSAARQEQSLKTDQDHALALDLGANSGDDVDPYFAGLAEFVTAGLERAGIPRCRGNAMAITSGLRRPLEGWIEMFLEWMSDPSGQGSELSSIGYDFRRVAGPLDAEPTLDRAIRTARDHSGFLRHLGRRAIDLKPPTGFFRDLVVEHDGDHVGRLDLKRGGILIVNNLARVYAVRAGVAAKGTAPRLQAAADAGGLDPDVARELDEAFLFLWHLRLRSQVEQFRSGSEPDDFLDPASLGPLSRRGLKEAFRAIGRAQRLVAIDLGLMAR